MINLNHLKYFHDATIHGSLSRAASLNFVSQSAVSQAIRNLGEALGSPLLEHQRKKFELTEAGKRAFLECQKIFGAVEDLQNGLKNSRAEYSGNLSFACSHSFAMAVLPELLVKIEESYPNIAVRFQLGNSSLIKDWVASGLVDFGIMVDDGDLSAFKSETLFRGNFCIATSRGTKEKLPAQGLIITRDGKKEVQKAAKALRQTFGKHVPFRMEVLSWEVIKHILLRKGGYGLVPDYVVKKEIEEGLLKTLVLEKGEIPYRVCTIYDKSKTLTASTILFLEIAKRVNGSR